MASILGTGFKGGSGERQYAQYKVLGLEVGSFIEFLKLKKTCRIRGRRRRKRLENTEK
jgi:hypothetical protein